MMIFAHRGLCNRFPENSMGAIMAAVEKGYGVEVDLRFTSDGRIALIHDSNLNRLFGLDKDVSKMRSEAMSSIRHLCMPEEGIVFLEELIDKVRDWNGNLLALHLKQEEQTQEKIATLASLLRKRNAVKNCIVFNLSFEACELIKGIKEEIKTAVIVSDERFESFVYLWEEARPRLTDAVDFIWLAEYRSLYSDSLFCTIRDSGKRVIAVSNELHRTLGHPKAFDGYSDAWDVLVKNGIYGVCTDYPEEFSSYLKETVGA